MKKGHSSPLNNGDKSSQEKCHSLPIDNGNASPVRHVIPPRFNVTGGARIEESQDPSAWRRSSRRGGPASIRLAKGPSTGRRPSREGIPLASIEYMTWTHVGTESPCCSGTATLCVQSSLAPPNVRAPCHGVGQGARQTEPSRRK